MKVVKERNEAADGSTVYKVCCLVRLRCMAAVACAECCAVCLDTTTGCAYAVCVGGTKECVYVVGEATAK